MLDDRLLVKAIDSDIMAQARDMDLELTKDIDDKKTQQGIIIDMGPGLIDQTEDYYNNMPSRGDKILYTEFAGSKIDVEGVEHLTFRFDSIIAILD